MIAIALALHLVAAIIWIGGMFYAYMILRPVAASLLEPPLRLKLWSEIFQKFFVWVWGIVIVIPVTGYFMVFTNWDGFKFVTMDIHIMHGLGILMILIYMHLFFAPYRRMNRALADNNIEEAAKRLSQIRVIVMVNMLLGLTIAVVASAGRYW
ncbi:CopD family protein [Kaarinaea lacus]